MKIDTESLRFKLFITFFCAVLLEANSIAGLRFLIENNYIGMSIMVFINPLISLPLSHWTIEADSLKVRLYIALAFATGFTVGVMLIRPFLAIHENGFF